MQKFRNHLVGVDQGEATLFSDFEHDGDMWTGTGPRESKVAVIFREPYQSSPAVMVNISMWDVSSDANTRMDVQAEDITTTGFQVVFRTWGDSRIARVRVAWQSIGELPDPDQWDVP